MPEPLTNVERQILDFLIEYLRRNTYQPSVREIGKRFDIKSTKTVSEHLHSLAEKGWLERDPSRSRGVRILAVNLHPETVTIPCYDGATMTAMAPFGFDAATEELELDRKLAGPTGSFFLTMDGDSMEEEGIRDGDLLLVDPISQEEVEDGDAIVVRFEGETTVRRFFQTADKVVLEPANPMYTPISVRGEEDLMVLGRVIGIYRRLRPQVEASAAARPESDEQDA